MNTIGSEGEQAAASTAGGASASSSQFFDGFGAAAAARLALATGVVETSTEQGRVAATTTVSAVYTTEHDNASDLGLTETISV